MKVKWYVVRGILLIIQLAGKNKAHFNANWNVVEIEEYRILLGMLT